MAGVQSSSVVAGQPVGLTSSVGPDDDLGHGVGGVVVPVVPGPVPVGQSVDRQREDLSVIGGGVRPGVAGADELGKDLTTLRVDGQQRVEPERTVSRCRRRLVYLSGR